MSNKLSGLELYYKCISSIRMFYSDHTSIAKHEVESLTRALANKDRKLYDQLLKLIIPSIFPNLWPLGTHLRGKYQSESTYVVKEIRWDRYVLGDLSRDSSDVQFTFDGAHKYLMTTPKLVK